MMLLILLRRNRGQKFTGPVMNLLKMAGEMCIVHVGYYCEVQRPLKLNVFKLTNGTHRDLKILWIELTIWYIKTYCTQCALQRASEISCYISTQREICGSSTYWTLRVSTSFCKMSLSFGDVERISEDIRIMIWKFTNLTRQTLVKIGNCRKGYKLELNFK